MSSRPDGRPPLVLLLTAAVTLTAADGCRDEQEENLIRASGHVEATDVRVSTKWGGTLESFDLEEGDRFEPGQDAFTAEEELLVLLFEGLQTAVGVGGFVKG